MKTSRFWFLDILTGSLLIEPGNDQPLFINRGGFEGGERVKEWIFLKYDFTINFLEFFWSWNVFYFFFATYIKKKMPKNHPLNVIGVEKLMTTSDYILFLHLVLLQILLWYLGRQYNEKHNVRSCSTPFWGAVKPRGLIIFQNRFRGKCINSKLKIT